MSFSKFLKIHNGSLKIEKSPKIRILGHFWGTNYIKITPTNILKPKDMINIPGILAKSKKSSDLHDPLKIYRQLKYGPARKF